MSGADDSSATAGLALTPAPASAGRPAGLRVLVIGLPLVAAATLAAAVVRGLHPISPVQLAVAVAASLALAVADLRPVRLAPGQRVSLATVPALVAAFLLPAALAASLAAVVTLAVSLARHRSRQNALFNASQVAIAVVAAALVGGLPATITPAAGLRAGAGAVLFSVLTLTASTLGASLERGEPFWARLRAALGDSWPQTLTLDAMAVTVAVLLVAMPWAAPLPLLALPLVYRMNLALERQLRAHEELAGVLAAQRRFLTDVSHQVGNPLATIRANLSLIGPPGRTSRQERRALSDAIAEAGRLSDLFRRLRVLAETDDELPLRLGRVDLAELAGDLVRAYTLDARRRGVRLRLDAAETPSVQGDEDLLRHAAANLIDNAIRHSGRGDEVLVRVAREHSRARLQVVDKGTGIDAAELAQIFERFQGGPGGGSGLGLAIARNVVERHGGHISVESRPGEGSRFTIDLPAA